MLTLTLDVRGAPAGNYTVEYKLHDLVTERWPQWICHSPSPRNRRDADRSECSEYCFMPRQLGDGLDRITHYRGSDRSGNGAIIRHQGPTDFVAPTCSTRLATP
jgi:hypothetical protein